MVNNVDRNPGNMVMISRRLPDNKGRLGESSGEQRGPYAKGHGDVLNKTADNKRTTSQVYWRTMRIVTQGAW